MAEIDNNKKLINVAQLDKLAQALNSKHEEIESLLLESVENLENLKAEKTELQRIEEMLGGKSLRYVTQEEYDALSDDEKNDVNIVWNIIDAPEVYQTIEDENLNTEDKTIVGAINEVNESIPCYDTRDIETYTFSIPADDDLSEYEVKTYRQDLGDMGFITAQLIKIFDVIDFIDVEGELEISTEQNNGEFSLNEHGKFYFQEVKEDAVHPNVYIPNNVDIYVYIVTEDNSTIQMDDLATPPFEGVSKGVWIFKMVQDIDFGSESIFMRVAYTSGTIRFIKSGELTLLDEKYVSYKPGKCIKKGTEFIVDDEIKIADHGAEIFNYPDNIATGNYSHAEGFNTKSLSQGSHAEGVNTKASGSSSHAEGNGTEASGNYSHAEGISTTAASNYQHVQGKYNIEDSANVYQHIVGNGTGDKRSNAHTLDWDGNAWFAGKVTAEGNPENAKDLTTKEYVDNVIENNKLEYTGFTPFKEFTEENIIGRSYDESYSTSIAYINNRINAISGQKYKVIITLDNGSVITDTTTCSGITIDGFNAGYLEFYNNNYILTLMDGVGFVNDIIDLNTDPIYADNRTVIQFISMSYKEVAIVNIEIKNEGTLDVTSEFLEKHRFITEEEREKWNDKTNEDKLIADMISENVLTLTTDKRQKVEMVDGTEIVLPTVEDFTEIHLYFSTLSDLTLIFPAGKYQKTPEIKANKTYEFIFTYVGEWLIGYIEYGN